MNKEPKTKRAHNISARTFSYLLFAVSAVLITVSIFIPPQGVIDSSVLVAVGELTAMGGMVKMFDSIDKGQTAKFQHGQTSITIGDDDPDTNTQTT